ncbi:YbjN domain-containing protein [Streptomyces sp. SID3343]|uniref:YbjN domain-containing protein n=1 Tax=Streptomyces sp. SID3343 TaxID=2690260 RepID=UPI00136C4887|nr:YbjN domain-containing protein [Streptomyces sp. SID3343]MYW01495.1 YbjN domain-containing protein [Streptomyces sp. SID3343]
MSIDPSSLPRSTFVPAAPVVKPSADLINQVLDELQVNHFTDEEGDICAPWEGFRVYFMLRGDKHEIFTVRMFLDREFAPGDRPRLLELLDEWHRQFFWPKVYTHEHEGALRLIGEAQLDCEPGINRELFVFTTRAWISTCISFGNWINEQYPDPNPKPADGDEA